MNRPQTVINFINAAHFIDHYAMLVFAAAVVAMSPALNISFSELLICATPGFVAFGAGALAMGWLGDRWSRRHMMAIFFFGIGASLVATGFATTPLQLTAALFVVGLFASIYHPVGTAMIVSYAERIGREVGVNGVWGNLGVASSALATGAIVGTLGWRWAFFLPGAATILIGFGFIAMVRHEKRVGHATAVATARVAKRDMWRVVVSLIVTVIAISTTFNAITVALPKLFAERLADLASTPGRLGLIAAGVYAFGAAAQYTIGGLIDRYPLKPIFLIVACILPPLLYLAASAGDSLLVIVMIGVIIGLFGQITVNDAMVGKHTSDEWRARAYAVRYFIGFTAAGASVALTAALHQLGGFHLMLQALAALCVLALLGALIFPVDQPRASPSL